MIEDPNILLTMLLLAYPDAIHSNSNSIPVKDIVKIAQDGDGVWYGYPFDSNLKMPGEVVGVWSCDRNYRTLSPPLALDPDWETQSYEVTT